jgi:23S rRNA pseudouridine955/2504/2580 synthase
MGVERKAAGAGHGGQSPTRNGRTAQAPAPPKEAAAVRYVTVDPEYAGQRLDNFLIRLSKGVPKSHIYRVVRSGEVRINRGRASADQRLSAGDRIRIPPMRTGSRETRVPPALAATLPVVFEDEHLLVVDKPAGMAAHGGSGVSFGVIERLRAARPQQPFLELAHRLDRDTSGLLVLAKSRRALLQLHAMLRQGEVEKRYLALVAGRWLNDRQHVKLALSKVGGGAGKVRVDAEGGSAAHTVFELRERFRQFSLLEAELRTGRTHQIRVHLAHIGFPIAGDDKYGDFELNRRLARGECGARLARMFLHAWKLRLPHPVSGEPVALESRLPPECDTLLEALRRA